jgi:lipoprotein-releasing system permease protein
MKFELQVGLRYVRAKNRGRSAGGFVSFISFASIAGIAVGVMALIVVMSVMNGFQEELRDRIIGVTAHAQIQGFDGELSNWPTYVEIASKNRDVLAAAPFIQQQGMFSQDQAVRGAIIRGVEPEMEDRVADFSKFMKAGALTDLHPGEFDVVLGKELANALGVRLGDKVTLIAPQGLVTPAAVLPRVKQLRVVGIFEAGMYEYDAGLALMSMKDVQAIYQMGDKVSGVRLKLTDMFRAPQIAESLTGDLPADAYVQDWTKSHVNYFRAVQMEKNVMFLILLLIMTVAAFSIVSALVTAVQDKRADVAILRTLGASPASIMGIFVIQGGLMGLIGLIVGVTSGVTLALNVSRLAHWVENAFKVELLPKDVYYISDLPSKLLWSDVAIIAGVAFVLTLLATLYPSWRAARINPAEALRYE